MAKAKRIMQVNQLNLNKSKNDCYKQTIKMKKYKKQKKLKQVKNKKINETENDVEMKMNNCKLLMKERT